MSKLTLAHLSFNEKKDVKEPVSEITENVERGYNEVSVGKIGVKYQDVETRTYIVLVK